MECSATRASTAVESFHAAARHSAMPGLNMKSLLRTAKERQRQERQQSDAPQSSALDQTSSSDAPPLSPPPACLPASGQPAAQRTDQRLTPPQPQRPASASEAAPATAAAYLTLSLSQPLPPPRRLTSADLVSGGVAACYYASEWCDAAAEADMLRCCRACPTDCWVALRGRSLQCWGNTPSAPSGQQRPLASGMPAWLAAVMRRVEQSGLFDAADGEATLLPRCPSPDHALINRYEAGQGIMAHKDGPAYHPLVAILSLSSHAVMHFYRRPPGHAGDETGQPALSVPALSVLLEPRSLLVFAAELYTDYYHAIHERSADLVSPPATHNWPLLAGRAYWERPLDGAHIERSTRYSLTIRASK